jgi:hypothetical protein
MAMKVVAPGALLAEAADVLASVRDDIVVVGAAAIEVALADAVDEAITPTRDVDVVVPTERAAIIVAALEGAGLRRSDVQHERAFTWVRDDLKVQLVRTFHPFPKPPASELPANPVFGMAASPPHQTEIAFADAPTALRLRCANAACLIALKHAAFGRTRKPDNTPVERDYHDVHLLLAGASEDVASQFALAEFDVRTRALDAIEQLAGGGPATIAAARQMVRIGTTDTQPAAEAEVRRVATLARRRLPRSNSLTRRP